MTPKRIGIIPGPYLTQIQAEENTRTGANTQRVWEGSYSECYLMRNQVRMAGASEIAFGSLGDGNWRLQYSFPYGEDGWQYPACPSIHELEVNMGQLGWHLAPKIRAGLGVTLTGIVKRCIDNYLAGHYNKTATKTVEQVAYEDVATLTANNDLARRVFGAVALRGADSFIEYHSVYRRTLTAATPLQVTASFEGVGKIWTSFEVQQFEGIDPTGWFQLDANMQWLKAKPQVLATAGQKTQVVYSYTECHKASGLYYDAYGSAQLADLT